MESTNKEEKKTGLSFSFSKKHEAKQLTKSVAGEGLEETDKEKDYVLSLESNSVKSTKPEKPKAQEFVIPLIKQNKWRRGDRGNTDNSDSEDQDQNKPAVSITLEEQAAKEILQASSRYKEQWEDRGKEDTSLAIPLLMQNKVPEGFETDDRLDVELRPDEPHDADYEQIPIEHFGLAMLRGMGWKEGRGIGKHGKVIVPVEAQLRPKGLGLGADRSGSGTDSKKDNMKNAQGNEEELVLKKNAFCIVTAGVNKNLYGIVEGIDEDNARVMVKLTLNGKAVNVMQCNIRLVDKGEYNKFSKYLNKEKVDKYKADEERRAENGHRNHDERGTSKSSKRRHKKSDSSDSEYDDKHKGRHKHKKHKKEKDRSLEYTDSDKHRFHKSRKNHESDRAKTRNVKDKSDKSSHKSIGSDDEACVQNFTSADRPWLRNDLRVRVIDKDLKKGRYYKEKVVIIDVPYPGSCVCKTEDGKVLEGVVQSSLETVIPRADDAFVAIVMGQYRGQIGQVMKKDKDRCLALIQLLADRDTVLKLQYDEICEYVGDVHARDDF